MLQEFSKNYIFENNMIISRKTNKAVKQYTTAKNAVIVKLQNNTGKWKQVTVKKLLAVMGDKLKLPEDAIALTMCGNGKEYYIRPNGEVYSYSIKHPQGIIMTPTVGRNGYPKVRLVYHGKRRNKEVHTLLAEAFIMNGYASKGLCVLHADDDKLNCNLNNISVGTFAQNNQDSWDRGRQPRKKNSSC